ncbi:MAG: sulfurtransferase [Gammaproteobacteria bacterium]|nr:sulfurtransferase [Gammaproteobacteria bacterium]MCP5417940.1 sulfurtransferase [Chromatiaceae bacterium]
MKKLAQLLIASMLLITSAMAWSNQPLVDVDWVKSNIGSPQVVFLDVRGQLDGLSKADYLRAHIPGAVYTDYAKDGWRVKDKNGTPGMLPPIDKLEQLIGDLGIDNASHVVIIPNGGKSLDMGTATRIYWTFKVLGHDDVSILDGGMLAYTKEVDEKTKNPVNPLEKGAVKPEAKSFKGSLREEMIVTKEDVKAAMASGVTLLDHRPNDQYIGINKHGSAARNGTIPGSHNLPESWLTRNGGGTFRQKSELEQLYAAAGVPANGAEISFCNTGHWASLGWFASSELMGNKASKMYDGSMLEWSADTALPVEQKITIK